MTFCKKCVKKLDTLATVYYKQSSYFQSLKVYWEAWGHSVKMERKKTIRSLSLYSPGRRYKGERWFLSKFFYQLLYCTNFVVNKKTKNIYFQDITNS